MHMEMKLPQNQEVGFQPGQHELVFCCVVFLQVLWAKDSLNIGSTDGKWLLSALGPV